MSYWHGFIDSQAFRWFAKRGPGRLIFRTKAYRRLNVARNYLLSSRAIRRDPGRFHDVRTFCLFIGHNKSGTSLVGGLLDAHPNVILSDEVDALQYVEAGFGRAQIFHLLLKGSRAEARKGRITARRLEPYSYSVPGQWQGRSATPLVVGDGTSGTSTRRLGIRPVLLDRLSGLIGGIDLRLIQVIRNPFDPISVMMVRGRRSFQNAIDHYFGACEILVDIRRRIDGASLLPVHYEKIVTDPEGGMTAVCRFLGVEVDPDYLNSCARILRRRPDRSREMVEWTRPWIDYVQRRIGAFDFLKGYSYEN
jgi:hypothetical protein